MREHKFRKGDVVAFRLALSKLQGVVTEDRGPLGIGGRHLYGIQFQFAEEPSYIELPAVDMELIEPAEPKKSRHNSHS